MSQVMKCLLKLLITTLIMLNIGDEVINNSESRHFYDRVEFIECILNKIAMKLEGDIDEFEKEGKSGEDDYNHKRIFVVSNPIDRSIIIKKDRKSILLPLSGKNRYSNEDCYIEQVPNSELNIIYCVKKGISNYFTEIYVVSDELKVVKNLNLLSGKPKIDKGKVTFTVIDGIPIQIELSNLVDILRESGKRRRVNAFLANQEIQSNNNESNVDLLYKRYEKKNIEDVIVRYIQENEFLCCQEELIAKNDVSNDFIVIYRLIALPSGLELGYIGIGFTIDNRNIVFQGFDYKIKKSELYTKYENYKLLLGFE